MAIERQHRPIDKEFEEADYTGVLDISDRKLRIFPNIGDDIHDVLEIFVANLSGNRFDKFPKHILRYSNLVTVNLCHNSLRTVPVEIVYLKELKELKLSRNYIQHLPPSISDMKLQLLAVNNNRLCELPMDIGKMKTLKSLDVSRNDLTELPPSIVDLSQLNYLDIFRNEIRELPEDIHKIPLTYFNISANMLSRIPLSLRLITTLTHFSCDNNPLEWPPAQVCMRGMNHVFKFLHEIEKYGNDPQQFASNRDESLLRRRSNRSKKASRPISDASTLSGSGSEYGERSFIDEMTNFVQSAFGDNDTKIFQSDHSSGRYWSTQHSYSDERTGAGYSSVARARKEEYLSAYNKSGRYRSQSPGPLARQQLPISSSQPGTHYGTLPRTSSNKDVEGDKKAQPNRAPSPDKDRVLRTYMSETSSIAPENKEKKLSKYTSGTSTYNYQSYGQCPPSATSSRPPPHMHVVSSTTTESKV